MGQCIISGFSSEERDAGVHRLKAIKGFRQQLSKYHGALALSPLCTPRTYR